MSRLIRAVETDFVLSVVVTHSLDGRQLPETARLASFLDAQLVSNVRFSFSGAVDREPVTPEEMLRSSAVQHFLHYLSIARLLLRVILSRLTARPLQNKDTLGIAGISELSLGHLSVHPNVAATLSHCTRRTASSRSHILWIHFAYIWKPLKQVSDLTIFSPRVLLPFQSALDAVVRKLFSVHITDRYPWLFGPLRTDSGLGGSERLVVVNAGWGRDIHHEGAYTIASANVPPYSQTQEAYTKTFDPAPTTSPTIFPDSPEQESTTLEAHEEFMALDHAVDCTDGPMEDAEVAMLLVFD
ncbi:hypothetical protein BC834DRAFT_967599 [Gloeopeniophorella convolvens]|nr:hypothetical protein BC834DRAFT_967599 [Gloeopeniophorella convolvens]